MKKIITLTILIIVLIIMDTLDFLPWWSFLLPVFLLGILLPLQKWKVCPFLWGFIAGFSVWLLCTIYFEITYKGEIMHPIAKMIKVTPFLLHLIIGFIGGLLTGLGVYSGYLLRKGREVLELVLPGN
jgi:hypothetical protein